MAAAGRTFSLWQFPPPPVPHYAFFCMRASWITTGIRLFASGEREVRSWYVVRVCGGEGSLSLCKCIGDKVVHLLSAGGVATGKLQAVTPVAPSPPYPSPTTSSQVDSCDPSSCRHAHTYGQKERGECLIKIRRGERHFCSWACRITLW